MNTGDKRMLIWNMLMETKNKHNAIRNQKWKHNGLNGNGGRIDR